MSNRANGGNGQGATQNVDAYDPFDVLQYPCRFEIKAMGKHNNRFSALVQSIISTHIGQDDLLYSQTRPSRHSKYMAITCIIWAQSKEQIRAIYQDLAACSEVLMTL